MHALPAARDLNYVLDDAAGDAGGDGDDEVLLARLARHARPLRAARGDVYTWSHRLLHWGSRAARNHTREPRATLTFALSDPAFEAPPFAERGAGALPPVEQRLALIALQCVFYDWFGAEMRAFAEFAGAAGADEAGTRAKREQLVEAVARAGEYVAILRRHYPWRRDPFAARYGGHWQLDAVVDQVERGVEALAPVARDWPDASVRELIAMVTS